MHHRRRPVRMAPRPLSASPRRPGTSFMAASCRRARTMTARSTSRSPRAFVRPPLRAEWISRLGDRHRRPLLLSEAGRLYPARTVCSSSKADVATDRRQLPGSTRELGGHRSPGQRHHRLVSRPHGCQCPLTASEDAALITPEMGHELGAEFHLTGPNSRFEPGLLRSGLRRGIAVPRVR